LIYGGVKIWIVIKKGIENRNLKKFLDYVNSKSNDTCNGILGNKSYLVTPDELEKAGIEFTVVSEISYFHILPLNNLTIYVSDNVN